MALHQGVLSYIKFKVTRLQGYQRVEFFLQFFRIKWLRGYQGYRGYRGYDGPQSRGPLLIKFKVARLQGYQLVDFFLQIFRKKGYEVTRVTGVTGVTMALHQEVLSSTNLRLRGYRVTNWLNFLQIFKRKRLRGFQGYRGYNEQQDWTWFFLKLCGTHPRLRGYRVSKVTWLRNCKILHISCHI